MKKSWELIKALEEGKKLFRKIGRINEKEFLYYEYFSSPKGKTRRLTSWGFGSALGQPIDRIENILQSPESWEIISTEKFNELYTKI